MYPYFPSAHSINSTSIFPTSQRTDTPTMETYIKGITFVRGTSSAVAAPDDFPNKVNVSTNQNATFGGRYIYLCYQTTDVPAEAITGITVTASYKRSISVVPNGYTQLTQDLNEGAAGKWIYAWYTADNRLPPLREVTVVAGGTRHTYPVDDTWVRIDQDTNDGAGGDYIYICYKRDPLPTEPNEPAVPAEE